MRGADTHTAVRRSILKVEEPPDTDDSATVAVATDPPPLPPASAAASSSSLSSLKSSSSLAFKELFRVRLMFLDLACGILALAIKLCC
jgi:hypothetical protein